MRVAIAEFSQESNSFTGLATGLAEFQGKGGRLHEGEQVLSAHAGSNTVVGGFLEQLSALGHEGVPSLTARAAPGGPLTSDAYLSLRDRLVAAVARTDAAALLVSLHGAMVADGEPDPEADTLERLRAVMGDRPIAVVMDMHANLSPRAAFAADVIVGYRTYPHVDLAESGRRATRALHRLLGTRPRERPRAAYHSLPLLLPSINMRTDDGVGPMAQLQKLAADLEAATPELLSVALFAGFPYADVPCSNASVVAYSLGDERGARAAVNEAATALWNARGKFQKTTTSADEAVRLALKSDERPFVIADVADNPASGGSGDTTTLLRLLLDAEADAFVGMLYDPATVAAAWSLPAGQVGHFEIGGKVRPEFGTPVAVEAVVERHSDGRYVCAGPMFAGVAEDLGRTVLLRAGRTLIAVSEGRASVNDTNMLRMLSVDPATPRILALKVKGHFRASFGPLVARVIDAEAPGAAMTDFSGLPFKHLSRPLSPLDALSDFDDHGAQLRNP